MQRVHDSSTQTQFFVDSILLKKIKSTTFKMPSLHEAYDHIFQAEDGVYENCSKSFPGSFLFGPSLFSLPPADLGFV